MAVAWRFGRLMNQVCLDFALKIRALFDCNRSEYQNILIIWILEDIGGGMGLMHNACHTANAMPNTGTGTLRLMTTGSVHTNTLYS